MRNRTIILLLCVSAFLFRLVLLAQSPTLAPEAYSTIIQVEHIKETGLPLIHDPYGWGGQTIVPLPVFSYIIAFGSLFITGDIGYAIWANALAVLIHAAIFLLALELTNRKDLAISAAILAIFLPGYIATTVFTLSPLCLAIPLLFFAVLLFIKLRKTKEHRWLLLATILLLLGTHPLVLALVPFFAIALTLATIRRAPNITIQYEFALFATSLIAWVTVLLYKKQLLLHGISALTTYTPVRTAPILYGNPELLAIGLAVGIVPFGLALYAAYKEGIAQHPGIQSTIALAITAAILLAFNTIPTDVGIVIFAASCTALAAVGLDHLLRYARGLRTRTIPNTIGTALFILFVLTSVFPSVVTGLQEAERTTPKQLLDAAQWLKENSLPTALVLTPPEWGSIIEARAKRPTYINDHYNGHEDSHTRDTITQRILAGENLEYEPQHERISYIVSPRPLHNACLNRVYHDEITVEKVLCR